MDSLLIYLLKVTAGSLLLYLCFLLFYRNDTFYQRNRLILLLIIILPVVFPLLSIGTNSVSGGSSVIIFASRVATAGLDIENSVNGSVEKLNISNILTIIWLTGFILLLFRTSVALVTTFRIIIKGEKRLGRKIRIVVSDLPHPPFSFWPFAVIPGNIFNSNDNNDIIKHEECHIRQMHTADLVLSELFIAVFWFNPAAWFIKRSIVLNHEYLADNKIIHETTSRKEYQYRLVNLASGINSTHLIHNFNSNIKNRIAMINKTSTPGIAALKTIFILPAIIILFCLFSFKSSTSIQEKKENPSVFSAESKKKLIDLIYTNISYPSEARKQDLTGKFYVIVKMKKGGIVDQVSVSENDKGVTVPLLANEVVIMGYGSKRPEESADNKAVVKDKSLLTNEGIRVAKMLGSVKIPEWENKDLEFAINFKFDLNYPDPLPVKVSDIGSAIIMLDGKEITKKEYGDLNPSTISTVSVLKDKSATAVFGEKGKNGVVVVTTKK